MMRMRACLSRKIWIILFLGFASGLPLALTNSTLTAWYTQENISLMGIGLLSLVGQPYVYKFFWAPLIDRYDPLGIGRRRSWMLLSQIALIICLAGMSQLNPAHHPLFLAALAFLTAICSATQDIAICAYLAETPLPEERGLGSNFYVSGYRIAVMVAGAGALVIAQYYGWKVSYLSMGGLMLIGVISSLITPEPAHDPATRPLRLRDSFIKPLREFFQRFGFAVALLILGIMILYKLTDAFALSLSTVFILRALHYSLLDLGLVTNILGTIAVRAGGLAGAIWMRKLSLFKALIIFGLFQSLANLVFIWLFYSSHSVTDLGIAVFVDNFFSGMGNTAFLALVISFCAKEFAGTQFAILSALSAVGRVYVGPLAAWIVEAYGWPIFFWIAIVIGLLGVASLFLIRRRIC